MLVLAESSLEAELRERRIRFVDLNRDDIWKVPLQTSFTGLDCLWLPRTVLTSDFIVSMPKVKTLHWAGVTLSMKNLFGVAPGAGYGWRKTCCIGKALIEASWISMPLFPRISSLPMGSSAWRATGRCMALRAISGGSCWPTIQSPPISYAPG